MQRLRADARTEVDNLIGSMHELESSTRAKFAEHDERLEASRQLLQAIADGAATSPTPLDASRFERIEARLSELAGEVDALRSVGPASHGRFRCMMDSKVYAALGMFSYSDKDNFKRWSSLFEDVAQTTYGTFGREL